MTKREIYLGCAQSYFRNRHSYHPRFKKSKRHNKVMDSNFERNCQMVRHYIKKIRALDSSERNFP